MEGAGEKNVAMLQVRVNKAYDLKNVDSRLLLQGVSDPYTIVKVGNGQTQKTPVVKNNLNPVWDKDNLFSFDVFSLDDSVELDVKDTGNYFGEKNLGTVCVSLKGVRRGVWETYRQKLEGDDVSGELEFELKMDMVGPFRWISCCVQ